jgi:hypothetical protein
VRNTSMKARLITAAITMLVLGAVGLVYAAWTTNGSGSGYAKAGSAQNLSTQDVSASVTTDPTKLLYPGTNGDVVVQIHNPNQYAVHVSQLTTGSGSVTPSGGSGTPACDTTNNAVSLNSPVSVSIDVAAQSDSAVTHVDNAAHMGDSANGCQGATFAIPVNITGTSSATG